MAVYDLARDALFRLDPERAHHVALKGLRWLHRCGMARILRPGDIDVPTSLWGWDLPNPIGLAAGLDKNGEYVDALGALGFGFIEVGTVTPKPQPGNPKPRIFRLTDSVGLINRLGFNNRGLDYLIDRVRRRRWRGILGINIGKNKDTPNEKAVDDYVTCLRRVYIHADYITVNVSSPNTAGLRDLQQPDSLANLLDVLLDERDALASRHGDSRPLLLKLAPDLDEEEIRATAELLNSRRPDGVIATNTTIDRAAVTHEPLAHETGGLSGRPVYERSTEVLRSLRNGLDPTIRLIGVGGITDSETARGKIDAGADLLQIYTGFIYRGPQLIADCCRAFP